MLDVFLIIFGFGEFLHLNMHINNDGFSKYEQW